MSDIEDEGAEEKEEEIPKIQITKETVSQSLTEIGKIFDGSSYAFTKLIVEEKEIEEIGPIVPQYIHLRFISLAQNQIKSFQELKLLPHLLHLNGSNNEIKAMDIFDDEEKLEFLQIVNLSSNKIQELGAIGLKNLFTLNLSSNEIEKVGGFSGHHSLKILELRKNKLINLHGIANMPCLKELYVAENELTTMEGLSNLPSLSRLHLRKNQIAQFQNVPDLPSLEYLNLRENPIENMEQIAKLAPLVTLNVFNILGTAVSDEKGDDLKKEVLIELDLLKFYKINKEEIVADDVGEAVEEKKKRIEDKLEEERLAKQKEEEGEGEGEGEEAEADD